MSINHQAPSSVGGVPSASPSDNEVDGSSEGGVPSASPSDNLDEGSHVIVDFKGNLYKATIRKHRVKSGKQEFQIHYNGNKKTTLKWIPVDRIKSTDVACDEDTVNGDSVGPSIPPAHQNPDRAVRSTRGVSVASLGTSDEPTDVVVDPSSSDNIFEPSSDDESTEDVFSLSAYDQVENEDEDDESIEDHNEDDEDDEDNEGRDKEMTIESKINDSVFNAVDNESDVPVAVELRLKDIMIGVPKSTLTLTHPGNMRATELALSNYKEYCGAKSYLVKRALAAKLIQLLDSEGRRFLMKTKNGWMTMSDN